MRRQHATPLLIDADGDGAAALVPLGMAAGGHGISEAGIQALVQRHPSCLPIAEIDPLFVDPVPICTELNTPAGPIDNFMVTASGLPVLVECKLWRNPEGRREVIGQILDYAKELSRWSSSDLQREVSRRLKREGNALLDLVRAAGHDVDEIAFNDALTLNLRRGRFLLLIVGDGIRAGVEAIAEYLQAHAGLHFTFGLVEMPIYQAVSGQRLVVPRVLAKTEVILRTVVVVPEGMQIEEGEISEVGLPVRSAENAYPTSPSGKRQEVYEFWQEFLAGLILDDPDQPIPQPSKMGYLTFKFGAPGGSSWLTVFRVKAEDRVGLFLSGNKGSIGQQASRLLERYENELLDELGHDTTIIFGEPWPVISDGMEFNSLMDPTERAEAFMWLRERTNVFINALRPRIRAALNELSER